MKTEELLPRGNDDRLMHGCLFHTRERPIWLAWSTVSSAVVWQLKAEEYPDWTRQAIVWKIIDYQGID